MSYVFLKRLRRATARKSLSTPNSQQTMATSPAAAACSATQVIMCAQPYKASGELPASSRSLDSTVGVQCMRRRICGRAERALGSVCMSGLAWEEAGLHGWQVTTFQPASCQESKSPGQSLRSEDCRTLFTVLPCPFLRPNLCSNHDTSKCSRPRSRTALQLCRILIPACQSQNDKTDVRTFGGRVIKGQVLWCSSIMVSAGSSMFCFWEHLDLTFLELILVACSHSSSAQCTIL